MIIENSYNLSIYENIKILSVLYSVYKVSRNKNKYVFYVYNYINWNLFNQWYDSEFIEKDIKNVDKVAYKFRLTLISITNHR